MKNTSKVMKMGLVALFLSATTVAFGQTGVEGTIDKTAAGAAVKVGTSTLADTAARVAALGAGNLTNEGRDVLLFYKDDSKPGLTLVASRTEDLSVITPAPTRTAQSFTHYRWFYMGQDGAAAVDGTAFGTGLVVGGLLKTYAASGDEKLAITNLTEGYHYFKVRGIVNPDNITEEELCNVQEETYVVYVLPELQVSATGSVPSGSAFQYCETEAATESKVKVNTAYSFVRPTTPTVGNFDVKYRWYAVKQGADGTTWPDVSNKATNPASIGDVTLLATSTGNGINGVLPEFVPQIAGVGKYKVFVEVEYAAKDRNYAGLDESAGRVRPHVIYRGFAQAGSEDMILTVTPTPGKPHITIEAVVD